MEYVIVLAGAVVRQKPGTVKLGRVESNTEMPKLAGITFSGWTCVDSRWGAGYVENAFVVPIVIDPPPPPPPPPPEPSPSVIDYIEVVFTDGAIERYDKA